MPEVVITMLGGFDIVLEGRSALTYISNSPKSLLILKYLILNKGRAAPVSALIDLLWADEGKSAGPENALKTMMSRLRAGIQKACPELKGCIVSKRGSYMWNDELPCEVDVFRFEELCTEGLSSRSADDKTRDIYNQILRLYRADLSYASLEDEWMVSRSLYLHHLYFRAVCHYIELLLAQNDYDAVILVCRVAMEIDQFDERINLALMQALQKSGQTRAAIMLYRQLMSAGYKSLGIGPSRSVTDCYNRLIAADYSAGEIKDIRRDLISGMEEISGALVCDYFVFKYIYQMQVRNLDRYPGGIFLALLTVEPIGTSAVETSEIETAMQRLMKILVCDLRKGDAITRYGATQYALLLPMADASGGNAVISRIRKRFNKECAEMKVGISFQIEDLFGLGDSEKNN